VNYIQSSSEKQATELGTSFEAVSKFGDSPGTNLVLTSS